MATPQYHPSSVVIPSLQNFHIGVVGAIHQSVLVIDARDQ